MGTSLEYEEHHSPLVESSLAYRHTDNPARVANNATNAAWGPRPNCIPKAVKVAPLQHTDNRHAYRTTCARGVLLFFTFARLLDSGKVSKWHGSYQEGCSHCR